VSFAYNANDAKTFLKHFSDCLFYFCSTCADSITDLNFKYATCNTCMRSSVCFELFMCLLSRLKSCHVINCRVVTRQRSANVRFWSLRMSQNYVMWNFPMQNYQMQSISFHLVSFHYILLLLKTSVLHCTQFCHFGHHWPSFGKGENKGSVLLWYSCNVLIILFWCFWRVKDYKVKSVYWNIVWWGCESISINWLLFSALPKLGSWRQVTERTN